MVPSSSLSFPLVIQRLYAFHDMLQPRTKTLFEGICSSAQNLLDGIVQPISYVSASWDYVAFIRQFLVDCCKVELISAPSSSLACPLARGQSLRPTHADHQPGSRGDC
jgi:hypothetical protein